MSTVGSLRVILGLDSAEFTAGLTKAEAQSAKFAESQKRNAASIDRQVASLQKQASQLGLTSSETKLLALANKGATESQLASARAALRQVEAFKEGEEQTAKFKAAGVALGLALVAAGAGLVAMTKGAIDAADGLNDAAQKTGVAAVTIGGIGYAAEQAGGSLESIIPAIGKLNKSLAEASAGNEKAAEFFDALGISVKDAAGKTRAADDVLAEVADKFKAFDDGPEKAALALRGFGKAGAEMIPLLNEGGQKLRENIGAYRDLSGVTDDLVKQSDAFNDAMSKVNLIARSLGNSLASEVLPVLTAMAEEFGKGGSTQEVFASAAQGVKTILQTVVVVASDVVFVLKGVGREIGAIAAQTVALASLDLAAFSAISDAVKDDAARARKELDAFQARVMGVAPAAGAFVGPPVPEPAKRVAPRLKAGGGGGASKAEQELKKRLDGQVKAIQDFAKDQDEIYAFAEKHSQARYDAGIISLADFFSEQKTLRDAALQAQLKAFDEQVALQRDAAKKLTGTNRIDAENKIADAVRERARAVEKARQDEVLGEQQRQEALKQTKQRYDALRASMLEASGDSAGAAKIRIEAQVTEAKQTVTAAGGDPALVDTYRTQLEGAEKLKQVQTEYQRLRDRAAITEETILLAAERTGAGEIETLQLVGTARAKSLAEMQALVDKANELALSLGTQEAIAFAERLGLEFKRATAEVDPLLAKMRDVGKEVGSTLASGLSEAVTEGRSLRDVLKGIEADLLAIAQRELITKPLEGMFSGFAGNLFGGGGSSASGGGGLVQSIVSGVSSMFGGGKAIGGPVMPGSLHEVAENRPEMLDVNGKKFLLMGNRRGNIDPNPQMARGGSNVNASIVVQMPPGSTSQTMNQAGALVARQLAAAGRRNN